MVTATMGDRGSNVGEIVDRRVEEGLAEKVAYIAADATLTYEALRRQINRAAGLLRELGVRREQRVLLVLDDTTVFPIVFLAAMKLGAVPVPVSVLDKEENFRHYVADTHTELVVTDAGCLPRLRGALEDSGVRFVARGGDGPGVTELDEALAAQAPELDPVAVHRDDMAFWLYSSGSTGKPKGVVHLHHDIEVTCENYARQVLGITGEDVTFSTTKLFHAYGLGNGLSFPLWFGATSVLMTGPTKPESILHTLRTHRPTVFYSVPALFGALVREPAADGALDSVRVCASAAEPLPGPTVLRWRERFGLDIVDGIGSTEMLHIYCSNRPGELEPGTSGRPVPGYELRLVGEDGEVLTGPAVGGLEVRGDSCAAFYWHQHEKSKHSMRGEWFATGDRYERREDGAYAYVGRLDDMLKVGGLWVSPIDMEFVLMEHPRVRGVGVVGVTIDHASRIAAFVEIAGDPEDTGDAALADELRDFCKQRLRRYEYPHVVRFVEELPRTLTGKVQRFALRDAIALSPMPEPAVRAEAPRTL
jgi:benzoate-CoA ligase family protein